MIFLLISLRVLSFQGSGRYKQMGVKVPQILFLSGKCKTEHSTAHVDKMKNNKI
jgi:hypothetical protein